MRTFILKPSNRTKDYDSRVTVTEHNGISTLLCYHVEVASYNHAQRRAKVNGYYHKITAGHINSFLEFYRLPKMTKQQMEKKY